MVTGKAFIVYIIAPVFWFYFLTIDSEFDIARFSRYVVFLGAIVSILGIIQFYWSKTIFGLIPKLNYYDIDFTREELVRVGAHFRTRSVLPSPQIYGLFISLSFCLFTAYFNIRKYHSLILGSILLVGSLLSGQRIVFLVYAAYFGLMLLNRLNRSLISAMVLFSISVLAVFFLKFITDTILGSMGMSDSNLFNFSDIIAREYDVRWSRWIKLIKETNIFYGNGIGKTDLRDYLGNRIITSESYLVQLYYEGGIFVLGAFLVLYLKSILRYIYQNLRNHWFLLSALFIALIMVHSFLNPVFFAYWGIIVYPLTERFHKKFSERGSHGAPE
jgi:hypothetical protein